MSDRREHTDRTPGPDSRQGADADHERVPAHEGLAKPTEQWTRRRFGKTALGVTPVIATLYGRPLWAAANCTPSGWVSGNTSNHHELGDCGGKTPGYWQSDNSKSQHSGWANIHEELIDSVHGFEGLRFYVDGEPATLQDAVEGPSDVPFDGTDPLTRHLLRFGTAALLNARYYSVSYSLTEAEVTEIIGMTVPGEDGYTTPSGEYLTRRQVKKFLENTMDEPNWGG